LLNKLAKPQTRCPLQIYDVESRR